MDGNGVLFFFNGQRVARNDSANAVHYYFSDHLGTHGVVENATGSACEQDIDYYPYGGAQHDYCGTVGQNYKFTGKERDNESGLDHFGARHHASSLGRFMSPDALQPSRSHPLLLQQFLADPQNWNKYAYTLNSPVKDTDQGGHFTGDDHEKMQMNAMLANGYSETSSHTSAKANRKMDNPLNAGAGLPYVNHLFPNSYQNKVNPEHGERGENQTTAEAKEKANTFMSSKIGDAATRALQGDVRGALTDIGQASHTAQDVVRHNFEPGSQHPAGEAPATRAEAQAASEATQNLLNEFGDQLFQQGSELGLNLDQIEDVYRSVQRGQGDPPESTSTGGQNESQ